MKFVLFCSVLLALTSCGSEDPPTTQELNSDCNACQDNSNYVQIVACESVCALAGG